jgi:Popeye protein conserved region
MNSFNPDYFIHGANVLLLLAYSVRDILWLRLFALASSLIAIPYFAFQPKPLWEPIGWSVLFATINLFQSSQLLLERRPVKLTADEEVVRQLVFRDLPPRKVLQILSIGTWRHGRVGEHLIQCGQLIQDISLIIRGKVRVTKGGALLGELVAGNFVGSAILLTGVPAEVDAVVHEPLYAVCWQTGLLQHYLSANPEVRIMMQRHLARDLAGKLVSHINIEQK